MRSIPKFATALAVSLSATVVSASQKEFSVNDDVFAYPQYDISVSHGFILDTEAAHRIEQSRLEEGNFQKRTEGHENSVQEYTFEQAYLHQRPYFCSIPKVMPSNTTTEDNVSEEDQKKELARAADRGWELLKDLEGKQCLFYSTGWWAYTFCYNSHVKQFHSLPPGTAGARSWPPQEDPTTPSYFLGKHDAKQSKQSKTAPDKSGELVQFQKKAESSYLVQKMRGGTPCDLTGKDRSIEIQFHCHPQSVDRIGWIKETATCAYLMVIYTPRLCNDVAFQQPKESQAQSIWCRQILREDEVASIEESSKEHRLEEHKDQRTMIGDLELGAMKFIGKDGQKIEKGKIVMTAEETAEIVMMQKDGQIQGLSRTELRKLNLNPETVEEFRKELQKLAGKKDWKIERLDENGQIQLRGIVSDDKEDAVKGKKDDANAGSEEEYKTGS